MSELAFVVALLVSAPAEIFVESRPGSVRSAPARFDPARPLPRLIAGYAPEEDLLARLPAETDSLSVPDAGPLGAAEPPDGTTQPAEDAAPDTPAQTPVDGSAPVHAEDGEHHDDDLIVVTGRSGPPPGDPLESVNLASFEMTQAVDAALVRPAARTYQRILPEPVRAGIRNFINNLREPVAFINFLLQLKPGKAAETAGRFALNSTVGAAGLVDVAKRRPFNLPRRPNGLANTLGFYGVKPGAFLFVPLIGPTTVRDFVGDGIDRLFLPLAVGKPFSKPEVGIGLYVASSLDQRAEFDEKLEEMHQDSDPYARTREDYLQSRQDAIDALKGLKPWPSPVPSLAVTPSTEAREPAPDTAVPVPPLPVLPDADPVPPAMPPPAP